MHTFRSILIRRRSHVRAHDVRSLPADNMQVALVFYLLRTSLSVSVVGRRRLIC